MLTFWHKVIAVSQIVGGGLGLVMMPILIISTWIGGSSLGLPTFIAINAFSAFALIYLLTTRWKIFHSERAYNTQSNNGVVSEAANDAAPHTP